MNKELAKHRNENSLPIKKRSVTCITCDKKDRRNQHRLDPLLAPLNYESARTMTHFCLPRKYTSIHNDETAQIFVSVGKEYNQMYLNTQEVKEVESQVVGKWVETCDGKYEIHLKVLVSTEKNPEPFYRNFIFCQELGPNLEAIALAESCLLEKYSFVRKTPIRIHFKALQEEYDRWESWGCLGDWVC